MTAPFNTFKQIVVFPMRSWIRRTFYRSKAFQSVVGFFSVLSGRTKSLGISHLSSYLEEDALGPLQREEAIALFGIIRVLRPKTVVEFGFYKGHSAFNFLCAMDSDARLYSYDVSDDCQNRVTNEFPGDGRLFFIKKSQTDFEPADIHHRQIDFVFLDASHYLPHNMATFKRFLPNLASGGIVAVHDTGLWNRKFFTPKNDEFEKKRKGKWITDELYAHRPDERAFVNWITSEYKEFAAIHFHSTNVLRHGLSLIQRQAPLLVD